MAVIRFYYLSSVTSPATPAVTPPATLTEDELEEPLSSHSLSSDEANHRHHVHNHSFSHSFHHRPTSAPTLGPITPDEPHPHSHANLPPSDHGHMNLSLVIFAVIGGVLGLISLALCARQAIAYCRSPRHNAPLTTVEREQLVREMAEYAETANRRARPSLSAPPPPYERAPSYESSCASHQAF
ncbi:hypothetical protein BC826DRAFT_980527 [Russula brevipes]|nr:hypothetical protein BC826DRAFT_980527 [Russula brevipes]